MHTFAIEEKTKARVTSVSINGENHGKDIQPAVTLSLTMTVANDWLINLSGWLKNAFYSKGKSNAAQPELPGTEVSDAPSLRMPECGPIDWTKEYTGLALIIDHGLGGDSDIVVADCKADSIVLEFKEGGSVEVSFKLKSNKPDEATRGRLTSLIKRDITITIEPPTDAQQDLDKAAPAAKKTPKGSASKAELDAAGNPFGSAKTPEQALAESSATH